MSLRSENSLASYLDDIGRTAILTADEEAVLCHRVVEGDLEARNALVTAHLRFVVKVAKRYRGRGLPFQDLIEEGNLGLVEATRRFDPSRGFRFLSYAVWWIRQSIVQALMENGRLVRLPAYRLKRIQKARRLAAEIRSRTGKDPEDEALAAAVGIRVDELRDDANLAHFHLSLDTELGSADEGRTFKDVIPDVDGVRPDDLCRARIRAERVASALESLPERQQRILRLYFGVGAERRHTLEEIGRSHGFTRENARQIKQRGLRELRQLLESDTLLSAVG